MSPEGPKIGKPGSVTKHLFLLLSAFIEHQNITKFIVFLFGVVPYITALKLKKNMKLQKTTTW